MQRLCQAIIYNTVKPCLKMSGKQQANQQRLMFVMLSYSLSTCATLCPQHQIAQWHFVVHHLPELAMFPANNRAQATEV